MIVSAFTIGTVLRALSRVKLSSPLTVFFAIISVLVSMFYGGYFDYICGMRHTRAALQCLINLQPILGTRGSIHSCTYAGIGGYAGQCGGWEKDHLGVIMVFRWRWLWPW